MINRVIKAYLSRRAEDVATVKTSDDFGNNYTLPKELEGKFLVHLGKAMAERDNPMKFPGLTKTFLKAWQQYRTNKGEPWATL